MEYRTIGTPHRLSSPAPPILLRWLLLLWRPAVDGSSISREDRVLQVANVISLVLKVFWDVVRAKRLDRKARQEMTIEGSPRGLPSLVRFRIEWKETRRDMRSLEARFIPWAFTRVLSRANNNNNSGTGNVCTPRFAADVSCGIERAVVSPPSPSLAIALCPFFQLSENEGGEGRRKILIERLLFAQLVPSCVQT